MHGLARPARTPTLPEIASWESCDVVELEGDDGGPCHEDRQYTAPASFPEPSPTCAAPQRRIVGGAAPPFAVLEITCELAAAP